MNNKRLQGKIKFWNTKKGFGFIEQEGEEKQMFIHIKAFANRQKKPAIGQVVTYMVSEDKNGRPCAADVMREDEVAAQTEKGKSIGLGLIVLTVVVVSAAAWYLLK